MALVFTDIQQIKEHNFVGNHAGDMEAFNAIDDFVRNAKTYSVADRAEAKRIMGDKGMGLGRAEEYSDTEILHVNFFNKPPKCQTAK